MVSIILSHDSALAYWSNAGVRMPQRYLKPGAAADALASAHGALHVKTLETVRGLSWLGAFQEPLDLLVPTANDRHRSPLAKYHSWNAAPPAGAFVSIDSEYWLSDNKLCNIVVSSPEFCFLQMAQVLSDYELIELGFELCGNYAIDPSAQRGMTGRPAVTTPKRLAVFCEKAQGMRGIKRAKRAVKWVIAGSRSPRESRTAMIASMSRTCGGHGLPAPLLNYEMILPPHVARIVGADKIYPDMYWRKLKTVLEYDSLDWHAGYEAAEHDARKRSAYRMLGLRVVSLTKSQFDEFETMNSLFEDLALGTHVVRGPASERQMRSRAALHSYAVQGASRERQTLPLLPEDLPVAPYEVEVEIPW